MSPEPDMNDVPHMIPPNSNCQIKCGEPLKGLVYFAHLHSKSNNKKQGTSATDPMCNYTSLYLIFWNDILCDDAMLCMHRGVETDPQDPVITIYILCIVYLMEQPSCC
jgi:hypothetical protein